MCRQSTGVKSPRLPLQWGAFPLSPPDLVSTPASLQQQPLPPPPLCNLNMRVPTTSPSAGSSVLAIHRGVYTAAEGRGSFFLHGTWDMRRVRRVLIVQVRWNAPWRQQDPIQQRPTPPLTLTFVHYLIFSIQKGAADSRSCSRAFNFSKAVIERCNARRSNCNCTAGYSGPQAKCEH